jgi:hypothetical protein
LKGGNSGERQRLFWRAVALLVAALVVAPLIVLLTRIGEASAFVAPEIQAIDDATFDTILKEPQLAEWVITLRKQRRYKPHTLTANEERLLALEARIAELEAAHSAAQRGGAAGLLRSAVAALLFGVAWAFAWYTPAYLVALAWANLRRGWVAGNTTPAAGEE